jgi:prolyl-tRNA synthetase
LLRSRFLIDPVSPLALNAETFPKVATVVDSSIASSSSLFAVHALSSSSTVFFSGKDIIAYLRHLETDAVKIQEVDFTNLDSAPAAKPAAKPAPKDKEDAKIEGAVQIAIGVKKEVDFPAWYTNVRLAVEMKCPLIHG